LKWQLVTKKISDERIEDEFGQNVNTESSNI